MIDTLLWTIISFHEPDHTILRRILPPDYNLSIKCISVIYHPFPSLFHVYFYKRHQTSPWLHNQFPHTWIPIRLFGDKILDVWFAFIGKLIVSFTCGLSLSLQWRHNERDGVSNHQRLHHLLNYRFRRRSEKTSQLRVTGLCAGNSPATGEFPAQRASYAENVSIW